MASRTALPSAFVVVVVALLAAAPGAARCDEVFLEDINSAITSPTGGFRWLDVADQAYAAGYRESYNYQQATVAVQIEPVSLSSGKFAGRLLATNLKPNFAYQVKLVGRSGTPSNENIGLAGRWWRETWNGTQWANGWNLNNKGDGYSPTPNDLVYFEGRDTTDPTSPTGLKYKHTGYMVMGYFITDEDGDAAVDFAADSSYHVLWKTTQRMRTGDDGPTVQTNFAVEASSPAYGTDHGVASVSIFGEWERRPVGGTMLAPGEYHCDLMLTEESFHGSGGTWSGAWAAAMGASIDFKIAHNPDVNDDDCVDVTDLLMLRNNLGRSGSDIIPPGADVNDDGIVNVTDLLMVRNQLGLGCE